MLSITKFIKANKHYIYSQTREAWWSEGLKAFVFLQVLQ